VQAWRANGWLQSRIGSSLILLQNAGRSVAKGWHFGKPAILPIAVAQAKT
jgi:hypothetical protein